MIDHGEGDRAQKQRQRDNLRDVLKFCENKIDCRRKLILQYFDENFDPANCNATCDNCQSSKKIIKVDKTKEAQDALALFKEISKKITLNQFLDVYRGSLAKNYTEFQSLKHFGIAKNIPRVLATRIVQYMCVEDIFEQHCVANSLGFVQTYMRV